MFLSLVLHVRAKSEPSVRGADSSGTDTTSIVSTKLAFKRERCVARISTDALRWLAPIFAEEAVVAVGALVNASFWRIAKRSQVSATLFERALSVLRETLMHGKKQACCNLVEWLWFPILA